MKKKYKWMLAAILICGASVMTSCVGGTNDNPVTPVEPVIENLSEKVAGKWIVDEKDGKPALTNQKLVINFESANKVSVSLSYMNFWHRVSNLMYPLCNK